MLITAEQDSGIPSHIRDILDDGNCTFEQLRCYSLHIESQIRFYNPKCVVYAMLFQDVRGSRGLPQNAIYVGKAQDFSWELITNHHRRLLDRYACGHMYQVGQLKRSFRNTSVLPRVVFLGFYDHVETSEQEETLLIFQQLFLCVYSRAGRNLYFENPLNSPCH